MRLKLTNDFVFKYVFGREVSKPILLDFVNAVLTDSDLAPVKNLTLKNPLSIKSADFLKTTALDISAEDESGSQIDIEIQLAYEKSFVNRSLYYWSQLYSSQLDKGEVYGLLKPVICINLVDFELFPELEDCHNCFMLQEIRKKDYILTEDLVLHFIELPKVASSKGVLLDWLKLILDDGDKEEEMTVLLKKNPLLKKAHDAYQECLEDREARDLAFLREKFLRDQINREANARDARQKGVLEGEQSALTKTAKAMKDKGFDSKTIADLTGLSITQIESL